MKERIAYQYSTAEQPPSFVRMWINSYDDPNWKDKLTDSNGITVDYDANGNPTEYWGWEYTWEKGRQLKKAHYIYYDPVTLEFKYNKSGLRTQKVKKVRDVITETTDYVMSNKTMISMKKGNDTLYFSYDMSGSAPATVTYIGGVYTYVKNLQGDIVGILDVAGNLVVEYKYDAWGNQTYISGILHTLLGKANPFRYRGYAYDEETGLYYLRSRYYNPELGKFVNADKNIGEKNYLPKHNIYCYCENDPIGRLDLFGNSSVYITVFIKYDKLADQIKNEDFGHAELKCGDYSYSYGRYREVYGQYGITGDGILVIDDYNKSVGENKEKGRKIYRYELNVSEEEVSAIEAYIENTIANIEPEKKKAKYYHIDTYHLLFNNCTTFTIDILVYACGDRVPERLKGVNTPSALYYVLENLYNNNDPFIKSREVLN